MNIESSKSILGGEVELIGAFVNDVRGELLECVVEGGGEHLVENELGSEGAHGLSGGCGGLGAFESVNCIKQVKKKKSEKRNQFFLGKDF